MYDHKKIEAKWQKFWEENKLFKADDTDNTKPKYYALDMFPYPSGAGLHVGHPEGYTATDILARYKRMQGYNVLHPMGWDAFGLPAENYAIKMGTPPEETTQKNIETFTGQIKSLGFSYDWEREINTSSPEYYKWTQWFFLFLYKNGLAYKKNAPVNWCNDCQTVLANEQVVDGKCERCGNEVVQKKMNQWFFKITDFIEDQIEQVKRFERVVFLHGWEGEPPLFMQADFEKAGYKVEMPQLPNATLPKWEEWSKELDKLNLDEKTVVIGHSLGGTLITRWLESRKSKVGKVILLAAPFTDCDIEEIKDVTKEPISKEIAGLAEFEIWQSDDDPCVVLAEAEKYAEILGVQPKILSNRQHLNDVTVKELIPAIETKTTSGLISGLDKIDWPESTKISQRNWIGKKEGIEIDYEIWDNKKDEKGERDPRYSRGHSKGDSASSAFFSKVMLSERIFDVKRSRKKNKLSKIYKTVETNIGKIIFDGKKLFGHFMQKNIREVRFRSDHAKIVIKALPYLVFKSETVGYFRVKQSVFRVVLGKEENGDFFVKTYYRCQKLSRVFTECFPKREKITVFTTRPDTNFGATFVVLAPEHPLVSKITTEEQKKEVENYLEETSKKTEIDRMAEGRKKTGAFTGSYAINNLTGKKMPIWVSDFVLAGFGTGALVGVPGHDLRDFEFAQTFDLPIIRVVVGSDGDKSEITRPEQVQEGEGIMLNSGFLNGLDIHEATQKIMDYLEEKGWGKRVKTYRLRDWLVSRQRFWGAPIPIVYCEDCGEVAVEEKDLPVMLPNDVDFKPTGESPLVGSKTFHDVKCPKCGKSAHRESDTMDTFVCSSWYYLRFTDAQNEKGIAAKELMNKWLPVDLYVGGAEHTVLHLLYSRFFTKALHKFGYINFDEPFQKLRHQGMILAEDGRKMSKSLGNVINPDEIVNEYGADTLRLYEMFMGPFDQSVSWSTKSMEGIYRFLQKIYRLFEEKIFDEIRADGTCETGMRKEVRTLIHKTVKKVTQDIENFKFNTAISEMMIFLNEAQKWEKLPKKTMEKFVKLLSPFAPHIAEELWEKLGNTESIGKSAWPTYVEALTIDAEIELVIQVNGKLRDKFNVAKDIAKDDAIKQAKEREKVQNFIEGKELVKEIFVPGKLVNLVVK